jgi:hypothetical protein
MVNSFTRFVNILVHYVKHTRWFCKFFRALRNSKATRFVNIRRLFFMVLCKFAKMIKEQNPSVSPFMKGDFPTWGKEELQYKGVG